MKHSWRPFGVMALVVTATLVAGTNSSGTVPTGQATTTRPDACATPDPNGKPPAPAPTTLTTVGQAYFCIFDNYFSGPVLDSRALLVPAFAAMTQELQRRGVDRSYATLPALTGRRDADWAAFGKVYERIANALPDEETRTAVAVAAIEAMVRSLDDNHARWAHDSRRNLYGLGLSGILGPTEIDPAFTGRVYLDRIQPGWAADNARLRLGDELLAVNGSSLFVNGIFSPGALSPLVSGQPGPTVDLTVHRPSNDQTFTVTLTAVRGPQSPPAVQSRLVDGNIAYVTLPGFVPELADQVLAAIASLREQASVRGVILDLRGNGGGDPEAVAKLLGALAHGRVTSYWCDVRDRCKPNRTDDSVPLLNLPFVALTDRRCASACDSFSSAVKDLRLGKLVGTRTAGIVSGPGQGYLLDDGSHLILPQYHEIAAHKEVVDTVGVAPDHYAPTTAADLSAGRDPGLTKAISLL